jgi:SAM-dependent methyltransferase
MRRIDIPEILDSDSCPASEVEASLRDMGRINRWFGGVSTSLALIERVVRKTGRTRFSLLEVAAGGGEVPRTMARLLAQRGITFDITYLDRSHAHLVGGGPSIVGDALALPFRDGVFELIGCSLFAHHLDPDSLKVFAAEALRVCSSAVLINDLVRHPLHLALVYAGFPLMRSPVSRVDGVASVRKAYTVEEMREMLAADPGHDVEIFPHYLYRMGVVLWK